MVLYVVKWDIHPDKTESYAKWVQPAIERTLSAPGLVELRAYYPAAGNSQIVVTYEFASATDWEKWGNSPEMMELNKEVRTMVLNVQTELWGPSPDVPNPIRP